jgi:uncharacterized protein
LANFIEIPVARLDPAVLMALLEEFATRDGTDYGEVETDLDKRIAKLQSGLNRSDLALLYDSDSEQWDLLSREDADRLLQPPLD